MATNTNKLPKRFKDKWVKALLSGDYGQIDAVMYQKDINFKNGSMCCLGVAEHISGQDVENMNNCDTWELPHGLKEPKSPKLLQQQFCGEDKKLTIVGKLATFNDEGKSFKYIASYINRYL